MGRRRSVVFILAIIALLGGLATGRSILFNISYLLGLLLIISFVWAWINITWVYISRVTRTRRTQVGRPLEERFTITNTSIIPKLWVELRDFSTLPAHFSSHVITGLGPRRSYTWRTKTICQQRGRYQLGPVRISTSDPFGLFVLTRELKATTNVVVFPMTVDIHQFTLPAGLLSGGDALRRRTHYVTTNAAGVRDYAPGDSYNRIHWRSTARRNRLIVKEFELDPLADIWIIPDMSEFHHFVGQPEVEERPQTTRGNIWDRQRDQWQPRLRDNEFRLPPTTEEYTVTVAASLAQYFLRRDRAVGLFAYGQVHEILQPDRGERQLNRILETLAVLRAQGKISIQDMLSAESDLLPRGTTVIIVTPTTDELWVNSARELKRRGLRVVNVMVNPASFGAAESTDPVQGLMEASGLATYVVNKDDNLTEVLSAPRGSMSSLAFRAG